MSTYIVQTLPYPCTRPSQSVPGQSLGTLQASGIKKAVARLGIVPYALERNSAEGYDRNGRIISIIKTN